MAKKIAQARTQDAMTDLILEVDEAYWRVVSLENKVQLAHELKNVKLRNSIPILLLF